MSFSNRVASLAAFSLAVTALIGLGTPGFAQDLGRVINAQSQPSVPQPVLNPAVATTVTNAPSLPDAKADDEQDDESVAYGTLDAAVAAQAIPDTIDEELQCMAGAIYFEAKGEPLSGQLAVAVGISKLARVLHAFARRLQVQERLTAEVADCIWDNLKPQGVAVVIEASHACMTARGVRTPGVAMVTSRMMGVFRDDERSRKEILALMGC